MTRHLTFRTFSETNTARCSRWHPGFPGGDDWTGADWSNAMQGEAGEAGNVVKKLRRLETGMTSARPGPTYEELRDQLADELGDVIAYADLLATYYGLDLASCVAAKFNAVSRREGFPERVAIGYDGPEEAQ